MGCGLSTNNFDNMIREARAETDWRKAQQKYEEIIKQLNPTSHKSLLIKCYKGLVDLMYNECSVIKYLNVLNKLYKLDLKEFRSKIDVFNPRYKSHKLSALVIEEEKTAEEYKGLVYLTSFKDFTKLQRDYEKDRKKWILNKFLNDIKNVVESCFIEGSDSSITEDQLLEYIHSETGDFTLKYVRNLVNDATIFSHVNKGVKIMLLGKIVEIVLFKSSVDLKPLTTLLKQFFSRFFKEVNIKDKNIKELLKEENFAAGVSLILETVVYLQLKVLSDSQISDLIFLFKSADFSNEEAPKGRSESVKFSSSSKNITILVEETKNFSELPTRRSSNKIEYIMNSIVELLQRCGNSNKFFIIAFFEKIEKIEFLDESALNQVDAIYEYKEEFMIMKEREATWFEELKLAEFLFKRRNTVGIDYFFDKLNNSYLSNHEFVCGLIYALDYSFKLFSPENKKNLIEKIFEPKFGEKYKDIKTFQDIMKVLHRKANEEYDKTREDENTKNEVDFSNRLNNTEPKLVLQRSVLKVGVDYSYKLILHGEERVRQYYEKYKSKKYHYVPHNVMNQSGTATSSLEKLIDDFLFDQTKLLILKGDVCIGKTAFLLYLENKLIKRNSEYSPIYIELKEGDNSDLNIRIQAMNNAGINDSDVDKFLGFKILYLVDLFRKEDLKIDFLTKSKSKMILVTREDIKLESVIENRICQIALFDTDQIFEYINMNCRSQKDKNLSEAEKAELMKARQVMNALDQQGLGKMIQVPGYLSILSEIIMEKVCKIKYDIFKEFFMKLVERESEKYKMAYPSIKLNFKEIDVIFKIFGQNCFELFEDTSITKPIQYDHFITKFGSEKNVRLIEHLNFISYILPNNKDLINPFFYFGVSYHILKDTEFDCLNSKNVAVDDLKLIEFLKEKVGGNQILIEKLLSFVEQSADSNKVSLEKSSNCCTLLNFSDYVFTGKNLSNIRIPYANLNYSKFVNCELNSADLSNVKLKSAYMINNKMDKINLTKADYGLAKYQLSNSCTSLLIVENSSNGTLIYVAFDNILRVYSNSNMLQKDDLEFESKDSEFSSNITVFMFDPRRNNLAVGCHTKVYPFRVNSQNLFQKYEINEEYEHNGLRCMSFSDKFLATGSEADNTIKLFNLFTRKVDKVLNYHNDWVNGLKFLPNDSLMSVSDDYTVKVLRDCERSSTPNDLKRHKEYIRKLYSFSAPRMENPSSNTTYVITASRDGIFYLWSFQGNNIALIKDYTKHEKNVQCFVYHQIFDDKQLLGDSKDQSLIISGSEDKTVRVWNFKGTQLFIMQRHESTVLCVESISKTDYVVSGGEDRLMIIWKVTEGQAVKIMYDYQAVINNIVYNIDDETGKSVLISSGSEKNIIMWRIDFSSEFLTVSDSDINSNCAFSNSGELIVYTNKNNVAMVYDHISNETSKLIGHESLVVTIAFSIDNSYLATGSTDGNIFVWDVKKKTQNGIFKGHTTNVTCLVFDHDNSTLISGSCDSTIRVWSLNSSFTDMKRHNDWVNSLTFYSQEILLSLSDDSTIGVWKYCKNTELSQIYKFIGLNTTCYLRRWIFINRQIIAINHYSQFFLWEYKDEVKEGEVNYIDSLEDSGLEFLTRSTANETMFVAGGSTNICIFTIVGGNKFKKQGSITLKDNITFLSFMKSNNKILVSGELKKLNLWHKLESFNPDEKMQNYLLACYDLFGKATCVSNDSIFSSFYNSFIILTEQNGEILMKTVKGKLQLVIKTFTSKDSMNLNSAGKNIIEEYDR